MAGFMTTNTDHLVRSQVWSTQIKDVLEEELFASKYLRMISDFPDGETLNIPSFGSIETNDYVEGERIKYTAFDTGNFQFTINEYKSAATYITAKMRQDSFYISELESSFVPKMSRALAEVWETNILAVGNSGQTASDLNVINGANHRFVGSGTDEVIAVKDFALAKYALRKANVPMTNLVAIVDPSVEYELSTLTNLVDLSFNKQWEGIVRDGMSTGMRFMMNIYGFDVYVSDFLPSGIAETVDGVSVTDGVANLFFSATGDVVPFIGSIRQPPRVDSEWNKDEQREEYVTTMRYGTALFRPENLVVVLTDTDQVS